MATNNALNGQFEGLGLRMPATFVQAGNPNTFNAGVSIAGALGDISFDTTGPAGYTCTTPGASGTAVWTQDGANASAFIWNNVTGTTQAMAVQNGYISNNASLTTFTLPVTATIGQIVGIEGAGAGGWLLNQNSGQTVHFGTSTTTTTTGSLASTNQYDGLRLICITANTTWKVMAGVNGNITVV